MEIIVCGPPHSGKTILISSLEKLLPADGYETIRVHKDGEGAWSNNKDQNEVKSIRFKESDIDNKFIKNRCRIIKRSRKPIVLVDIGGMLYEDKIPIFKTCSSFIVLSSDKFHNKEWQHFGELCGAKCIANISSLLDKEKNIDVLENAEDEDDIILGEIRNLERGNFKIDSPVIKEIADRIIIASGYGEKKIKKDTLDFCRLAEKIGCCSVRYVEGIKVSNNINYRSEHVPQILEALKSFSGKKKCVLDGARANWISALSSAYLVKNNVKLVEVYDTVSSSFLKIKKIKKNQVKNNVLDFDVHQEKSLVVIKFNAGNGVISHSVLDRLVLPELPADKKIVVSGKIPNWLLNSIVCSYLDNECYVYQPGKGEHRFICVSSKDESKLGTTVENFDSYDVVKFLKIKKILYLDMDRVLVDFAENARKYNVLRSNSRINWIKVFILGEKFWSTMNWFPGAESSYEKLKVFCNEKDVEIKVLSSVKIKSGKIGKLKWCKEHLGLDEKDVILVSKAADKELYGNEKCLLIDDNETNVKRFRKNNGVGIVFKSWDTDVLHSIISSEFFKD